MLVFTAVGGYVFLTNQYVPSNIAVVVIDPGFGDRSMADQAYQGLFEIDVVVSYDFRVADDAADAQDIMDTIAGNRNHDLIIAIGTEPGLVNAVQVAASNNPWQRFAFIGGVVDLDNVASVTFAHDEAAFLAGSLAATLAVGSEERTGVIGIIGSVETDPTVESLIDGFLQGVNYVNATPEVNVTLLPIEYVESYNDTDQAESLAIDMFDPDGGNATVIFAPVRASILGIRAAMEWANETFHDVFGNETLREPFVIGAEANQDYLGNPNIEIATGPSWIVGSVVPHSDVAVLRLINATLWDAFPGGNATHYDLESELVGLSDLDQFRNEDNIWVTIDMINMTTDYRDMIINGSIVLT